ncbi:MAG TPA: hypothetical protein VFJ64_08835 [Solirubrobacterales bacterium]|nr:hypothetical protein [Solirubrobacterales bacterium]
MKTRLCCDLDLTLNSQEDLIKLLLAGRIVTLCGDFLGQAVEVPSDFHPELISWRFHLLLLCITQNNQIESTRSLNLLTAKGNPSITAPRPDGDFNEGRIGGVRTIQGA